MIQWLHVQMALFSMISLFPLEALPGVARALTAVKAELPDGATAGPAVSWLKGLCGSVSGVEQ